MLWLYRKPKYGRCVVQRVPGKWLLVEDWGDEQVVFAVLPKPITRDIARSLAEQINFGTIRGCSFTAEEDVKAGRLRSKTGNE